LNGSRANRFPVSLSRLVLNSKNNQDKIIVIPSTITNDNRMLVVPKLTVCALKVTETARKRILAAGGKILTFDELSLKCPTGIFFYDKLLHLHKEVNAYC